MQKEFIKRAPAEFTSEALSGDGRNSAPNTHGAEEARERVRRAIEGRIGTSSVVRSTEIHPTEDLKDTEGSE